VEPVTTQPRSREYTDWRDAIEKGDSFRFAKVSGDRDLIRRAWSYLRDKGADPLSRDLLALKDMEIGINGLVEKARKFDALETILNDTSAPDRWVIERLAEVFFG
jgi:hypothetical protein